MPPHHAQTAPQPPADRDDVTRREVRRGAITMVEAMLNHIRDLEARVQRLERERETKPRS